MDSVARGVLIFRLNCWARWRLRGLASGIGFPGRSSFLSGIPSTSEDSGDGDYSWLHTALQQLTQEHLDVIIARHVMQGDRSRKLARLGLSKRSYYDRYESALAALYRVLTFS